MSVWNILTCQQISFLDISFSRIRPLPYHTLAMRPMRRALLVLPCPTIPWQCGPCAVPCWCCPPLPYLGNAAHAPCLAGVALPNHTLAMRPMRRALLVLPSSFACCSAFLYLFSRCVRASIAVLGGSGAWNISRSSETHWHQ